MNRRHFTLGLGALFGAPRVPLGAIATPSVGVAQHMQVASMISRAHNNCSPSFLMRHLKVDANIAGQLQRELITRNIITAPAANGVSKAVNPIQINKLPQAVSQNVPAQQDLNDKLKEQLSATHESDEPKQSEAEAQDTVPASHGDTDEVPSDLVTTRDRGGEDLV